MTFDRRGRGQSERPQGQRSRRQDEDDLAALIETLGLAPANVAGNSFGASIALGLAVRRPELFRTVIAHEPPLLSLLAKDPELLPLLQEIQTKNQAAVGHLKRGEIEEGEKQFSEEIALGPGSWELFLQARGRGPSAPRLAPEDHLREHYKPLTSRDGRI